MKSNLLLTFLLLVIGVKSQDSLSTIGLPPNEDICSRYDKGEAWLPEAFLNNAKCACLVIPDQLNANIIREVLIQRLDSIPPDLKTKAIAQKEALKSRSLSKKKYNRFVKKELVPIIYNDHIIAYERAGCTGDPAPMWGWKKIATKKVKSCKLVWFAIRYFGGSCSKRWGKW